MNIPLVDLKAQYQSIKDEVRQSIDRVLDGMALFLGENVTAFEHEFSRFCGARFGVGVGSGTEALHLALVALDIGPGDEVITVSHSFFATAEAISHTGAMPVFVDIDPKTYVMDVSQIMNKLSKKTKAIIPVHLYGQSVDMEPLLRIAGQRGLKVIEDACQAHGARYKGKSTGSLGDVGCFSFYYSKNLGAYGEAGMVVTNDEKVAEKIRLLRTHGEQLRYKHIYIGYNSRMDEIQAAILRIKLRHLPEWNSMRQQHAQLYNELLVNSGVVIPSEASYGSHVYHLYVIRVKNRNHVKQKLSEAGVATGIHYPIPIHLQQAYRGSGWQSSDLPVTETIVDEILSLPMYPELTSEQIKYVTDVLKECV